MLSAVTLSTPTALAAAGGASTVAMTRGMTRGTRIVTRGGASVPDELREQGWTHIGDPDSYAGVVLDAYQGSPAMHAKLFTVTAPNGSRTLYRHALVRGESFHNSFTAIAPAGQWFVSGEWGTIRRLLVFGTPGLNSHVPPPSQNLPLSAVITLAQPMRDVQGCAFTSSTALVCSTNDPATDLYPVAKQLLAVRLGHRLDGRPTTATVRLLGAVPQDPACPGTGETEGLDVHGSRLLVAVVSPCRNATLLYTYTSTRTTYLAADTAVSSG
jgi:hypothetical protein